MTITRSDVLRRAHTVWPMGQVPYSQDAIHTPDGYRQDCSGYVSAAWQIPPDGPGCWGGFNTVTMLSDGYADPIDPNALLPGDAIGLCGPGTAGDAGHIQLFVQWDNSDPTDNGHTVIEQTGGRSGPHITHYPQWTAGYRAFRLRGILSDAGQPPAVAPAPTPAVRYPLGPGNYFGPITGPGVSHGGWWAWERPYVRMIQQRLTTLGYTPGPVDGIFGPRTAAAVAAWQHAHYAATTQFYGQVWGDDWAHLFGAA